MKKSPRKRIILGSLILSLLLFPLYGWAAPTDSWVSLEREVLHLLKHYSPNGPLSESTPFEKKARFYIDAGLWSSAEQLFKQTPQKGGERLLLDLYIRRGQYDRVYAAYQAGRSAFLDEPLLLLAASQGALLHKSYLEALALLEPLSAFDQFTPHRYYLSAIAYWGLKDKARFDEVLEGSIRWSKKYPGSSWSGRLHLLKVYYHLSQKEYDLAFLSMGEVFNTNADLALLGLGWGYSEHDSLGNLLSVLEGFEMGLQESPYYSRLFQVLSRFMIGRGDLIGAIEIDQRERGELHKQVETLEKEIEMIREGLAPPSNPTPPGSLLKKALLKLEREVGPKKEITALLQRLDLQQRQREIAQLKERERRLQKEVERLRKEIDRRCLSLVNLPFKGGRTDSLYQKAQQAARQGKWEEVEPLLKGLLKKGPQGPYFEESAFRLGDMAFGRGDHAEANSYYQILIDRPASYLYRSALYKSAWAYFLQGKGSETLQLLFKQRLILEDDPSQAGPCRASQAPHERREHLRLFALSLRAQGGPARLIEWVKGMPAEESFPLFSDLARYYESAGRKKEMFQTIDAWVAAYPLYAKTPFLHQFKIAAFKRPDLVFTPDALQARADFVERYRPGSPWAKSHPPDVTTQIRPLLRGHLRFLINHYHVEAKKGGKAALHEKALPWYQVYLETFPLESETGEIYFLYAELLSEMKEEKKAAEAYQASAYQVPPHPLSAEAGYREVVLREKAPSDPNLWGVYSRFIHAFPSDRRVSQIYLKQAELAFQKGEYEKSRQLAQAVSLDATEQGCSEAPQKICFMGWVAQRLIAQSYLKEKNYSKTIDFLGALLSRVPQESAHLLSKEIEQTRSLLVLAYYQQGEALRQAGRPIDAANAYWEAYQQGEEMDLGPLALFEAASLWGSIDARDQAEEALLIFHRRYPQSALYHPVLIRLGTLYEESGRLKEAAERYEEAGRLRIDSALSLQALGRAISLYQGMERWEKVYLLALQAIERSQNDREKEVEWLVIGAEAKLMLRQDTVARKMLADAVRISKQVSSKKGNAPRGPISFHLAKAYLLLAESEIKQFEEIQLVAPLEKNLQKKKTLFNKLLQAYGEAANSPSPVIALTATHRMGEIFEEFSHALLRSERPQNLSAEERVVYENLLKEQALPYIQRAHEAYQQNIDWGKNAGVENEWVMKSEERIQFINQQLESLFRVEGALKG